MNEHENSQEAAKFLYQTFSKAGRIKTGFITEEERSNYQIKTGVITFKRKAMGICSSRTTRTLDELANIFLEVRMASTPTEARELVPIMANAFKQSGAIRVQGYSMLRMNPVQDLLGNIRYQLEVYNRDTIGL